MARALISILFLLNTTNIWSLPLVSDIGSVESKIQERASLRMEFETGVDASGMVVDELQMESLQVIYANRESSPYVLYLDALKAFLHGELFQFRKLLKQIVLEVNRESDDLPSKSNRDARQERVLRLLFLVIETEFTPVDTHFFRSEIQLWESDPRVRKGDNWQSIVASYYYVAGMERELVDQVYSAVYGDVVNLGYAQLLLARLTHSSKWAQAAIDSFRLKADGESEPSQIGTSGPHSLVAPIKNFVRGRLALHTLQAQLILLQNGDKNSSLYRELRASAFENAQIARSSFELLTRPVYYGYAHKMTYDLIDLTYPDLDEPLQPSRDLRNLRDRAYQISLDYR